MRLVMSKVFVYGSYVATVYWLLALGGYVTRISDHRPPAVGTLALLCLWIIFAIGMARVAVKSIPKAERHDCQDFATVFRHPNVAVFKCRDGDCNAIWLGLHPDVGEDQWYRMIRREHVKMGASGV